MKESLQRYHGIELFLAFKEAYFSNKLIIFVHQHGNHAQITNKLFSKIDILLESMNLEPFASILAALVTCTEL